MKYFDKISTLAELKKAYWNLAKIHHPDVGGDTVTMQQINAEYEEAISWIKQHGETPRDRAEAAEEVPAEYQAAVAAVVNLDGITLEMVGSWIWAHGSTYDHRDALKAAGYHFSGKRRAWYWRPERLAQSCKPSKRSYDELRIIYGAYTITAAGTERQQLGA